MNFNKLCIAILILISQNTQISLASELPQVPVSSMPVLIKPEKTIKVCKICYYEKARANFITLPCHHTYCDLCIMHWDSKAANCPKCRQSSICDCGICKKRLTLKDDRTILPNCERGHGFCAKCINTYILDPQNKHSDNKIYCPICQNEINITKEEVGAGALTSRPSDPSPRTKEFIDKVVSENDGNRPPVIIMPSPEKAKTKAVTVSQQESSNNSGILGWLFGWDSADKQSSKNAQSTPTVKRELTKAEKNKILSSIL